MKKCAWEGCNEEISDWMDYCVRHYIMKQRNEEEQPIIKEQQPIKEIERKPKQLPEFRLPDINERERLIVKQVCIKEAVTLLINLEDTNTKEFDELIDSIETLTAHLYRIIVGDCEKRL